MTRRSYLIRVDPVFKKELEKIKLERIKQGKDTITKSDRRLTKALRKMSLWDIEIKPKLIESEMEDDRFE